MSAECEPRREAFLEPAGVAAMLGAAERQLARLGQRLRGSPHETGQLWTEISVSLPWLQPSALIEQFSGWDLAVWCPSGSSWRAAGKAASEPVCLGLGATAVLSARGQGRFQSIREQATALFEHFVGGPAPSAPRVQGGFSFATHPSLPEPWEPFGEARFVLPRLRLELRGDESTLSLALRRDEVDQGLPWLERALRALSTPAPPPLADEPPVFRLERPARAQFEARTEGVLTAIRTGGLKKVVTAQCVRVKSETRLSAERTFQALEQLAPECTRFWFRCGGRSFLGATPERLVRQQGRLVTTEALAGTIKVGTPGAAEALLQSAKNRAEHAWVVDALVRDLGALGAEVQQAAEPEIRRLRNLLHLRTPIEARLTAARHVLDVLERLHPTPAVGGVPKEQALDAIAIHEGFARGWYAGPIGWFNAAGDGEFNVALRSGVLEDDSAWLYAGAGLVEGSVASEEYDEIGLKLTTLLAALRGGA